MRYPPQMAHESCSLSLVGQPSADLLQTLLISYILFLILSSGISRGSSSFRLCCPDIVTVFLPPELRMLPVPGPPKAPLLYTDPSSSEEALPQPASFHNSGQTGTAFRLFPGLRSRTSRALPRYLYKGTPPPASPGISSQIPEYTRSRMLNAPLQGASHSPIRI